MKTKAAVMYGKNDVRIREFELPKIKDDELLVKIISDSACLSTYKAVILGEEHKRVPGNLKEHPVILGHEMAGVIVEVGKSLKGKYFEGNNFVLQPAMGLESGYSAGYSYEYFGGDATYCIIPKIAIELGCVLPYKGSYYANASLAEPMSCIIGSFNANYHTTQYVYEHLMGIKEGGNLALLGSAGPMGIGAIDYAINGSKKKPKLVVVTDVNENRLNMVRSLITTSEAKSKGIELVYLNTSGDDSDQILLNITNNKGYDDVYVYAPIPKLIEQADRILGNDGCLNFFSGPTNNELKAFINFYNVHYSTTHFVGTSGGSTDDMRESLSLSEKNIINPSYMITHIGGLNAVPETIKNLPNIPGGKKLIYPQINMDLTPIDKFEELGENNKLFKDLSRIVKKTDGIWNEEAEKYLLHYYKVI